MQNAGGPQPHRGDPDSGGEGMAVIPTPALVVDVPALERNLARAADYFAGRSTRLRPHFKAHKCTTLLRRQVAHGACAGVTCATAWEAEVVARAGVHDDILLANEVAGAPALASLARAAERARVTVCVDHPAHVALLSGLETDVLVELDVGQGRCG